MARQRELQAAADARAVDRSDDGFRARLDDADQRMQRRLRSGLRRVELADIGAGGEQLAPASQHKCRDGRIGERAIDAGGGFHARVEPKSIDGRVVERDDGDRFLQSIVCGDDGAPFEAQTSSHSRRIESSARNSSALPSNTIRPWPIT